LTRSEDDVPIQVQPVGVEENEAASELGVPDAREDLAQQDFVAVALVYVNVGPIRDDVAQRRRFVASRSMR
jgi:hypothetical protein